jgi:hypothetical protein
MSSKPKKKAVRDLTQITAELQIALKRETQDIISIGKLLIEAQAQLEHGEWLPWLKDKEHFGSSIRTAENYMCAAKVAAKFATVANLKELRLRPSALYAMGRALETDDETFTPEAIAAIFKEAESAWVSGSRVYEIAEELWKPPPEPDVEEVSPAEPEPAADVAAAARRSEEDDILDGPPPELPPAPEAAHDVVLPAFDQAIRQLTYLQTKPLDSFAGSEHSAHDIRTVGDFLLDIASARERSETHESTRSPELCRH